MKAKKPKTVKSIGYRKVISESCGCVLISRSLKLLQTGIPLVIYGEANALVSWWRSGKIHIPKFSFWLHQHLPLACTSPVGQCMKGSWRYPISLIMNNLFSKQGPPRKPRDVLEEMDLVFLCKQSCTDAVNWRVTPSLPQRENVRQVKRKPTPNANLVIESSSSIQVFKVFHVGFASPEPQVTDFKVAPDWERYMLLSIN